MLTHKASKKILIPLDGSKNSLRGLKFALSIAKQSHSSVIGLNVCLSSIFTKNSILKQKSNDILKQAELMSKKADVSFSGVIKVNTNVGKSIITFAQSQDMDLIIIGSRVPDPYTEIFLGSVANHVVNKSKIPVTVVK